ncbi:MAG: hypothetical protein R6W77_01550 [Trueperaceae bacterium]
MAVLKMTIPVTAILHTAISHMVLLPMVLPLVVLHLATSLRSNGSLYAPFRPPGR